MARHAQELFEKNNPGMAAMDDPPAKGKTKGPVAKTTPPKGTPAKGPLARDVDLGGGAAGVSLYATAAQIGALHAHAQTNRIAAESAKGVLDSPNATEDEKAEALRVVQRQKDSDKVLRVAGNVVAKKVTDQKFIRGFGTDGGEEFLSFMLIGELLRSTNSKEWSSWDRSMTERLNRSQNRDNSWSGHHCITGQIFCTATAVLTLLTDRVSPGDSAPTFDKRASR
jgi:hypothetical protein